MGHQRTEMCNTKYWDKIEDACSTWNLEDSVPSLWAHGFLLFSNLKLPICCQTLLPPCDNDSQRWAHFWNKSLSGLTGSQSPSRSWELVHAKCLRSTCLRVSHCWALFSKLMQNIRVLGDNFDKTAVAGYFSLFSFLTLETAHIIHFS